LSRRGNRCVSQVSAVVGALSSNEARKLREEIETLTQGMVTWLNIVETDPVLLGARPR
jgi:hypothetical protein